ncbi:hypothetical protein MASR2M29_23050 [Spirochaetota bacterium]
MLIIFHAISMSLAFLLMLTAVVVAHFFRKKKWWLKIHKPLGALASLFSVLGLVFTVFFVAMGGGGHFQALHSWFGISAFLLAIAAPILGQAYLKGGKHKALLKKLHPMAGGLALLLMLLSIIMGLRLAGFC